MDIDLSLLITRDLLGLADLELNDHESFIVSADGFLSFQQQWTRNQVGSSYTDGMVTTSRVKGMLSVPLSIEVLGEDQTELASNLDALKKAMSQDYFEFTHTINSVVTTWAGEAADITMERTTPRMSAFQMLMAFSIPTQPNPLVGVI